MASPTARQQAPPPQAFASLIIAVLAVSMGAIFIRLSQEQGIPSPVIAAVRLIFAALILAPFALRRHWTDVQSLRRGQVVLIAASGVLLAVHFAAWIASLEYVSVLISVALVNTGPLWAAILEFIFLGTRPNRLVALGLLIGLVGSAVAAGFALGSPGANPALGSLLAVIGALALAGYWVIGRKIRGDLPLLPYLWLVYGCAALSMLIVVLVNRTPLIGYSGWGYFWMLLMAAVPQVIGHSAFNFALRYFPASYVGIVSQMETLLSALAAYLVFRAVPLPGELLGSAIIVGGVLLATIGQAENQKDKEAEPA
jgi:drug/metabolite transporter (DMT)-like permease